MAYKRKTKDVFILLGYYGNTYGWEEILTEETLPEAIKRKREYEVNMPQYSYMIKKKREKITHDK